MTIQNPADIDGTPQEVAHAAAKQALLLSVALKKTVEQATPQVRNARMQDSLEEDDTRDPYESWDGCTDEKTLTAISRALNRIVPELQALVRRQKEAVDKSAASS